MSRHSFSLYCKVSALHDDAHDRHRDGAGVTNCTSICKCVMDVGVRFVYKIKGVEPLHVFLISDVFVLQNRR